jgi:hypothetical protein
MILTLQIFKVLPHPLTSKEKFMPEEAQTFTYITM